MCGEVRPLPPPPEPTSKSPMASNSPNPKLSEAERIHEIKVKSTLQLIGLENAWHRHFWGSLQYFAKHALTPCCPDSIALMIALIVRATIALHSCHWIWASPIQPPQQRSPM